MEFQIDLGQADDTNVLTSIDIRNKIEKIVVIIDIPDRFDRFETACT